MCALVTGVQTCALPIYIKLTAPRDGSLHALTKNFFQRVDDLHSGIGRPTTYVDDYTGSKVTIADQIRAMARIAAQHGLGVLVLDEIQDLEQTGSKDRKSVV